MSKDLLWFRVIEDDRTTYFYAYNVAVVYFAGTERDKAKVQRYFQIPKWPTPPTEIGGVPLSWIDITEEVRNGKRR